MGGFSLLFEEEAFDTIESGKFAIVAGKHRSSEMYRRIIEPNPELRMPPEADPLKKSEIDLIARWIDEGAKWEKHWAYIPPEQEVSVPQIEDSGWAKNEIDHFVWEKLMEEGLQPETEAIAPDLLRRVSLDLIGLPPSESLRKAFLEEQSLSL